MLSTNEVFDRDVKQVLSDVKGEEIPLDFMVDIEQRLDQLEKKKKRSVLVWFFTGIVLASGLTFGLLRENGQTKSSAKIPKQNVTKTTNKARKLSNIASLQEAKTIKTDVVQSTVLPLSDLPGNVPSLSREVVSDERRQKEYPSDVIQAASPHAGNAANQQVTEMSQDSEGLMPNQQTDAARSSDSAQSETTNKEETTREEVSPATTIPEIAVKLIVPKWTHSFGFYTGMSGVVSSVQTNDQALIASVGATNALKYRELRSTQERSTSSIDISLRYRMAKEHLVLQTGLDFFEWGEQLKYDYNFVYDGVNRYSYLSIPFYLGYRQAWGKVELTASIGSSIGHVLKRDGYYLQPDLTTVAIEQASTWTSTGYLQVALSYTIDKFRFSLAPTYRKSFTPVVQSTFTNNTYQSFGLQMGIAVNLK
jgi:hypothetical protein